MARAEPWRLETGSYPVSTVVQTRFGDMDMLGHINNVAMAGIFETARVHFHHLLARPPAGRGLRMLVAAVDLTYVAEAHFPDDIDVRSGIGRVGNSSWTLLSAAFQHGKCVATCDTVMVLQGADGSQPVDDSIRFAMEHNLVRPAVA